MKPTAYLVNTARGPIVDEGALLEALTQNRIAGAGIDVFSVEPLPVEHPFRKVDNLVLTPHLGYVTGGSISNHYRQMVEGIDAWFKGEPPRKLVEKAGLKKAGLKRSPIYHSKPKYRKQPHAKKGTLCKQRGRWHGCLARKKH